MAFQKPGEESKRYVPTQFWYVWKSVRSLHLLTSLYVCFKKAQICLSFVESFCSLSLFSVSSKKLPSSPFLVILMLKWKSKEEFETGFSILSTPGWSKTKWTGQDNFKDVRAKPSTIQIRFMLLLQSEISYLAMSTGIEPMTFPTPVGRSNHWATGRLVASIFIEFVMTRVLHTARISNVEVPYRW